MSNEIGRSVSELANHELFVELLNRGQYRAAAAMFVEVTYRARYPLNFPEILSGMNAPEFESRLLKQYQSDPDAWNQKWNDDLTVYKADLQFMWGLATFKDEAHSSSERLKLGLMETSDDADAGAMRYLRGVMAFCIGREARKSKKSEAFYRDIVGDFDALNVESDRASMAATFNSGAIGVWYTGE